jgi:hypothetical protein
MIMAKTDVAVRVIGGGAALFAGSTGLAQAQDVAGFYGGIGVGANAGEYLAFGDDEYSFDGGPVSSLFAGYNLVSGNLVYGGELVLSGKAGTKDDDGLYTGTIRNMIDLKGRVGTMVGNTLLYGSLGYTVGDVVVEVEDESGGDVSGFNFGVGFESAINEKIFVGGDVTKRNLDGGGTLFGGPGEQYMDDVDLTTVSIRLGFRF